ncbi:MAG TPA: dTMP kinase [Gaiellales bacterium]|nr:dTMP kinase [Gaiellales bacterium]
MFISFEGLDGCGKTTQAALLAEVARAAGRDVVSVREPGGTAAGERIRALLLDPETTVAPWTEALLYAAARAELVAEVIRPALDGGATVIADRYVDSSLAYQGVARGLGWREVLGVNLAATGDLLPDRTVLLELAEDQAAARRDGAPDRIEAEPGSFHASVADGFATVARVFPDRVAVVDAAGDRDEVAARVRAAVGL